ncbi:hypothetical protein H4R19_002177 [Coemansia spiralis]|nr:hypothetical protein H4R19_002177 [Coemansia spiralis]
MIRGAGLSRRFQQGARWARQLSDGSGPPAARLTFLRPNINPHGEWAEAADSSSGSRLWSLSERRALLMYGRALEVHRKREPDWHVVAQRLDRSAVECRFIYMSILRKWRKYHAPTDNAGVSADMLLHPKELESLVDPETRKHLCRLADPPEPALQQPRTTAKRPWTDDDDNILAAACPLYRRPTNADLAPFVQASGRTAAAARVRYYAITKLQGADSGPLTAAECDAIATAAAARAPLPVRWVDVRDSLPQRTFAGVLSQTLPIRAPSHGPAKTR